MRGVAPGDTTKAIRRQIGRSLPFGLVPLAVLMIGLLLSGPSWAARPVDRNASPTVDGPGAYLADQALVRFRSGLDPAAMARVNASMGATVLKSFWVVPNLQLVRLPAGISVPDAVARYGQHPEVLYAQPNGISRILGTDRVPNDPLYPQQWNWNNTGQNGGTPGADVSAQKAWDLTTGRSSIVVTDIDTGLDYNHQDLQANVWKNVAECNGAPGVDDDHNGYVDDCHGIDTINHDTDPMDDNNHGTHTGGTIGAVGNNGVGVTGLNWSVQVMPCKSHDASGNGSIASIIECYQYVVMEKTQFGYSIVSTNNSYGGCPEACGFDQATMDGIAAMGRAGVIFAAAAGNNASDNDATPFYPANYFLPNVIAVAATTNRDALASFSDYGVRTVSVGAPGEGVLSTVRNNGYANFSGTSMASPHVAGLVALIQSRGATPLSYTAVRNLILAGGDKIAALAGRTITGRRLDAYGSLTCSNQTVAGMLRPLERVPPGTQTVAYLNINCANPAGALNVTITPGGKVLSLKDDGVGPDLAKNDGIYSATWAPSVGGDFTFTFSNGDVQMVHVG